MLWVLRSPELDDVRARLRPAQHFDSRRVAFALMFKAFKKWWKYLGAKLNRNFEIAPTRPCSSSRHWPRRRRSTGG